MTKKILLLTLTLFLVTSCGEVTIEAEPGKYHGLGYDPVSEETEYTIKMTMLETRSSEQWGAFLAFGMIDLENQNRLEIYLNQHQKDDELLIAGYRYIEKEEFVYNRILMENIPIGETIKWDISWQPDRTFTIKVADQVETTTKVNLGSMAGYAKVSSAKGKIHRY
ncbi:MAG: hypothetical protein OIF51_07340 [Cellvibrionaceae bacterium]|nr:hypothetical protein [Cellvibrionaceae bacterium]